MKKLISALLSVCMVSAMAVSVMAEDAKKITVIVDDRFVVFKDQDPVISENNDTLIPVRGVLEAMDATVIWGAEDRSVTVKSADETIELVMVINNPVMKKYEKSGEKVAETEITMSTPPRIMNNKTMVPLRVISENINAKVGWNGETRQITITSKEYDAFLSEKLTDETSVLKDTMPYFWIEQDDASVGSGADFCIDVNIANTELIDTVYETDGVTATLFYDNTKVKPVNSSAVFNEMSTTGQVYGSEYEDTKAGTFKYNFLVASNHQLNLNIKDGTVIRIEFQFVGDATEAEVSLANTIQSDGKYGMSYSLKNKEDKKKLVLSESEQIYVDTTPVKVVK